MKAFKKAQKNLQNDMIVLGILELLIFAGSIFLRQYISTIMTFTSIGFAIVLLIGYDFAKKGKKSAGTIGMIVGVLMMLTIISGDIIDFLIGLFVVIHSSRYNETIENKKRKKEISFTRI